MELQTVRFLVEDRVAWIILNRPHRLNAWTGRMHLEYRHCITRAESDDDVRVIVVTGEGRGFCAGADAKALEKQADRGGYDDGVTESPPTPGYGIRADFDHPFAFHFGLRKPTVAAMNGATAGVGLVLACFCDVRFAAKDAKITAAHGRLGLPVEFGLSWLLPKIVGLTHAMDLLLTSRVITGEEAQRMGLVSEAVEPQDLRDRVREYATDLAHHVSPASLAVTKRQVYDDLFKSLDESMRTSTRLLDEMMGGPDFAEGVRALLDKRRPEF